MQGDNPVIALQEIEDIERRSRACEVRAELCFQDGNPDIADHISSLSLALQAMANIRRSFYKFPIVTR